MSPAGIGALLREPRGAPRHGRSRFWDAMDAIFADWFSPRGSWEARHVAVPTKMSEIARALLIVAKYLRGESGSRTP